MPELTAIGSEPDQRWQRPLPETEPVRIGRSPRNGWKIPWDISISREHADLIWQNGQLSVICLDTARNPVEYKGKHLKSAYVRIGESFQIGTTKFVLSQSEDAKEAASLLEAKAFGQEELKQIEFRDASRQMELIAQLPQIIAATKTDEDFAVQLVRLLLDALPRAEAAAVIRYPDLSKIESGQPLVMRWDSRAEMTTRFKPSRKLVKTALTDAKSVLHIWSGGAGSDPFTISGNLDWAICTPILGDACKGWCLYVSGASTGGVTSEKLKSDVRFTELISQFIGSIRQLRQLEKTHADMKQFFSPTVMETLSTDQATTLLVPKESDITVIFCDVRGFSKMTEQARQNLIALLERVSQALGVMTRGIVKYDGIIADFQGDAALGFWGWPVALDDGPLPACRAALAIYDGFSRAMTEAGHPLADFRIGIGISHGRAVAGKIGSTEQSKIGVFGPVVNLGSRLEGMTKQLRVPILIDDATAEYVRNVLTSGEARCRRLGKFQPSGMNTSLVISELLPPAEQSEYTNLYLTDFESAVECVTSGDWSLALDLLRRMPQSDGARTFLHDYLTQHRGIPPAGWDGVIRLSSK